MARYISILFVVFCASCWPSAVEHAALLTNRIYAEYMLAYKAGAKLCLDRYTNWDDYDACVEPLNKGAAHVARLRQVTLTLDAAYSFSQRKAAACEWLSAVRKVDSVVSLPSTRVALESKWRKKC